MTRFTDLHGRVWVLELNVTAIRRVRDLAKVNLLDFEAVGRLLTDPIGFCDVLYCLCQGQVEAAGVSDVQFGEGLAGDALLAAFTAFQEECGNFCPRPSTRQALQQLFAKSAAVADQVATRAQQQIQALDADQLAASLLRSSSSVSGSSAVSSASPPAPCRGAPWCTWPGAGAGWNGRRRLRSWPWSPRCWGAAGIRRKSSCPAKCSASG